MPEKLPNIVIITTHDTGRHFHCYGVPSVHTPNIDQLAGEGVKFTNMFAVSSICSPSRGGLMTGQYPQRNGLMGLSGGMWNWAFNDPTRHLSHQLKNMGYDTALFGVHHETADLSTLGLDLIQQDAYPGDEVKRPSATAAAENFTRYAKAHANNQAPFYAQIGMFETHTPYTFGDVKPDTEHGLHVPEYATACPERVPGHVRMLIDDQTKRDEHLALLQGSVRRADMVVGQILDGIRKAGLEENTLVLFNVDHGVELPNAKWTMYDAGLGIGFILRWPGGGVVGGRDCDWMLSNVDFLPTLMELIGKPIPPATDGVSFARACRESVDGESSPREVVFAAFVNAEMYAARTPRWKMIRQFSERSIYHHMRADPVVAELYDLQNDPLETVNLIDDPAAAEAKRALSQHMWQWMRDVDDPILKGSVTPPAYHMAMDNFRAALA